jgi:hypothetical protein
VRLAIFTGRTDPRHVWADLGLGFRHRFGHRLHWRATDGILRCRGRGGALWAAALRIASDRGRCVAGGGHHGLLPPSGTSGDRSGPIRAGILLSASNTMASACAFCPCSSITARLAASSGVRMFNASSTDLIAVAALVPPSSICWRVRVLAALVAVVPIAAAGARGQIDHLLLLATGQALRAAKLIGDGIGNWRRPRPPRRLQLSGVGLKLTDRLTRRLAGAGNR